LTKRARSLLLSWFLWLALPSLSLPRCSFGGGDDSALTLRRREGRRSRTTATTRTTIPHFQIWAARPVRMNSRTILRLATAAGVQLQSVQRDAKPLRQCLAASVVQLTPMPLTRGEILPMDILKVLWLAMALVRPRARSWAPWAHPLPRTEATCIAVRRTPRHHTVLPVVQTHQEKMPLVWRMVTTMMGMETRMAVMLPSKLPASRSFVTTRPAAILASRIPPTSLSKVPASHRTSKSPYARVSWRKTSQRGLSHRSSNCRRSMSRNLSLRGCSTL